MGNCLEWHGMSQDSMAWQDASKILMYELCTIRKEDTHFIRLGIVVYGS